MPTETGTIDLKAQKAGHDDAAKTATNYVTEITSDGIWVTPSDGKPTNGAATSTTTGWHISDVLEYFRQGVSWFKLWLDSTVMKLRLGQETSGHIVMDDDSLEIFADTDSVASFGSDEARMGSSEAAHLTMNDSGMTAVNEDLAPYYQLLLNGNEKTVRYNDAIQHAPYAWTTTSTRWLQTSATGKTQLVPIGTTYTWERNAIALLLRLPSPWGWVSGSDTAPSGSIGLKFVDEDSEGRYNLLIVVIKDQLTIPKNGQSSGYEPHYDFTISASSDGGTTENQVYIRFFRRINFNIDDTDKTATGVDSLIFSILVRLVESGVEIPITAQVTGRWPVYTVVSKSPALSFGTSESTPGAFSASLGQGLMASGDYQTVVGRYNQEDVDGEYAFIVGGGTASDARVNSLAIRKDGGLVESVLALDVTDTSSSNYYRAVEANDKNGQNIGNLVAGREPNANLFYIETMNGSAQNALWMYAKDDGTCNSTFNSELDVSEMLTVNTQNESGVNHGFALNDESSSGHNMLFGIGSGAVNRGIFDNKLNGWLVHADDSAFYAGAINVTSASAARSSLGLETLVRATNTGTATNDAAVASGGNVNVTVAVGLPDSTHTWRTTGLVRISRSGTNAAGMALIGFSMPSATQITASFKNTGSATVAKGAMTVTVGLIFLSLT